MLLTCLFSDPEGAPIIVVVVAVDIFVVVSPGVNATRST
jgi:hypothetical protein